MSKTHSGRQIVVVFFGMTASGKSYLARAWAERHGYPYLNTDVVRKELAGIAATRSCPQEIDKGLYSPEFSRKTYERLLDRGERALAEDAFPCVILDGSYQLQSERRRVLERFADRYSVFFVFCRCGDAVTRTRLAERLLDDEAVSDGRLEIYLRQKKIFEDPREIPPERLLELDTNASLEYLIGCVEHFLSTSGPSTAACGKSSHNK